MENVGIPELDGGIEVSVPYRTFVRDIEDEDSSGNATHVTRSLRCLSKDDPEGHSRGLLALASQIMGRFSPINSPYAPVKPQVYADWAASGKSVCSIENFIQREILPSYGNTHTSSSYVGKQSTFFRREARQAVAEAVNAHITGKAAEDVVLFAGNGVTGAINLLVSAIELYPKVWNQGATSDLSDTIVLVGPWEHHSNILPWREINAHVVSVSAGKDGRMDVDHLESLLRQYTHNDSSESAAAKEERMATGRRKNPIVIGSFSAASNVTGLICDVDRITDVLHRYGALSFWDYASAAPSMKLNVGSKDAMVMSGHKFVGGPGTPGILIIKKRLLVNAVPFCPGGGSVFFVTSEDHRYLSNREERNEGGTPDIIGAARLGLAMNLKQSFNCELLEKMELELGTQICSRLSKHPQIVVLGDMSDNNGEEDGSKYTPPRLPIVSFMIRHGCYRFLHYNFVAALLNDLFGIQSRGGCACAGPYAQQLLGISPSDVRAFVDALSARHELLRPGFTRISFSFATTSKEVEYVLRAIEWIADNGKMFLPAYRMDYKSGEWRHASRMTHNPDRKWLGDFNFMTYNNGAKGSQYHRNCDPYLNQQLESESDLELAQQTLEEDDTLLSNAFDQANDALQAAQGHIQQQQHRWVEGNSASDTAIGRQSIWEDEYERLRWFSYPWEVEIEGNSTTTTTSGDVVEAGAAPIDPTRCRACLLQNNFEPFDKVDEKRHGLFSEQLETSNDSDKDHILEKSISGGLKDCNNIESCQIPCKACCIPSRSSQDVINKRTNMEHLLCQSNNIPALQAVPTPSAPLYRGFKLWPKPPKPLTSLVCQASIEWSMIEPGDRILLGVSGGKDSLTLLHVFHHLKRMIPIKFTLACATVDPQTPSFDPSPLKIYMSKLGVEYHYLSAPVIEQAKCSLKGDSLCSYCSRMKRGLLYACCRENGYTKLALAQHLDDLAESFVMSALHNGQVRTMKANYLVRSNGYELNVIRPLAYVREKLTADFATKNGLPIINENCPACFEQPKERARIKKLLSREESLFPRIYGSLRHAMLPLMAEETYTAMNTMVKQVQKRKRSKKNNQLVR